MSQQSPEKVKMLKSDAIIIVKISTGFLQKLQALMMYMGEQISTEQMQKFQEESQKIKDSIKFSEDWMNHLFTIAVLVREIEREAIEQGFSYEMDMVAIEKLAEELNKETDSPQTQSPEQPE